MKKGLVISLVFLFLIPAVLGATIHGKVFTYSLKSAENSIVSINTVPKQMVVSTDGTYSFTVPVGNYTISATLKDELDIIKFFVEANISVVDEGDYVRDLILFPYERLDELDLDEDLEQEFIEEEEEPLPLGTRLIISGFLLIILGIIVWLAIKDKGKKRDLLGIDRPSDEYDEIADLLAFIRKNRRVTQKDIRKEFPLSEAKISLMITDLESQGRIRKIKRGRGNIIVYVKD